jgi:hypothetical protein
MHDYGFSTGLFDWARSHGYLAQTVNLWERQLPYLATGGNGRIVPAHLAPQDFVGVTIGDVLVWPVPFILSVSQENGQHTVVLESSMRYARRARAMLMIAHAMRRPFLQPAADVDAEATHGLITEDQFNNPNLNSNIMLYVRCQKLIIRVLAGCDLEADSSADDNS